MVSEIPLESVGLLSVAGAAARLGVSVSAVQKWVGRGLLPAVVAGSGKRAVHLLRVQDVDRFTPPARGRPAKPLTDNPSTPAAGSAAGT